MNSFEQGLDWMIQRKCIECDHYAMMRVDQKPLCIGCKRSGFI
jgi:hypothetical protein